MARQGPLSHLKRALAAKTAAVFTAQFATLGCGALKRKEGRC